MSRDLRADYSQLLLLGPSIEEWIGSDHPARFVREFVDSLDVESLGFAVGEEESPGRPAYSAEMLLKLWLYGYLLRIRSSRELERGCREQMGLIWLAGRHTPDHNTLWRFWRRHRSAVRRLFSQTVTVAVSHGLVGMVLHVVDGTKIQARASTRKAWSRQQLQKLLAALSGEIDELEEQIAREGEGGPADGFRLPEALQDRESLRRAIRQTLTELEAGDREAGNPSEPEARMMRADSGPRLAYNAQIVVDAQSGLMVAQDVLTAGSDNHALLPLIEQAQSHVGAPAEQTVADGGYFSGSTIFEAEQRGHVVLVNLPADRADRGRPFESTRFIYDAQKDLCVCPRGEPLPFTRERVRRGVEVREYRCRSFRDCPVRAQCSRDGQGRRIEITPYRAALARHEQRWRTPEAKDLLRQRSAVVELPFARIKALDGFRRFTAWGLEAARQQWAFLCALANLKRFYPRWANRQMTFA